MDKKILELLKMLPPVVAIVAWDVVNENITVKTIELADMVTKEEWEKYELVRCVAAGNPEHPPVEEARLMLDMMFEDRVPQFVRNEHFDQ